MMYRLDHSCQAKSISLATTLSPEIIGCTVSVRSWIILLALVFLLENKFYIKILLFEYVICNAFLKYVIL